MQFSDACISFLAHHRLSQRLKRLFPLKITASYLSFYCFWRFFFALMKSEFTKRKLRCCLFSLSSFGLHAHRIRLSLIRCFVCKRIFENRMCFYCLVIKVPVLWQLVKITISFHICQQLFSSFYFKTRTEKEDRVHPIPPEFFTQRHAPSCAYAVLAVISDCYPQYEAGYPRVTHPSATKIKTTSTGSLC